MCPCVPHSSSSENVLATICATRSWNTHDTVRPNRRATPQIVGAPGSITTRLRSFMSLSSTASVAPHAPSLGDPEQIPRPGTYELALTLGDRPAHGVEALVHVHGRTGDAARQRARQEGRGVRDLQRRKLLRERRVLLVVVDDVVDDAGHARGARREGARGDRVDANTEAATRLVREHARVALERGLGRAHAAAVAGDDALARDVRER